MKIKSVPQEYFSSFNNSFNYSKNIFPTFLMIQMFNDSISFVLNFLVLGIYVYMYYVYIAIFF